MGDEIRQPGERMQIPPLNRVRGSGKRKYPRKSPQGPAGDRRRPPPADQSHQVDEYV